MGALKKIPSEGGSGGKRGHSGMEHSAYTAEIKDAARVRRRLDDRDATAPEGDESGIEIDIIQTFVVPAKRERYLGFVRSPRRRPKFLNELYHFSGFDSACVVPLDWRSDSAEGLLEELRRRGAGKECRIVSVRDELDGATMPLEKAITEIFAFAEGTIVSCIRSRLAYYEGEAPKNRFILERTSKLTVR
jgi:hypothetical protein